VAVADRRGDRSANYAVLHNNLANALRDAGRVADAAEHYRRGIEFDPTLAELHENLGNVLLGQKDADGSVVTFEFDQLEELAPFTEIDAEVGGLATPEDIEHAAALLEPNSSAALLIWEDCWAAPFAAAVRDAGGVLIESARIPYDLVEAAFEGLPTA